MGLSVSHGAFEGSYSMFSDFRSFVCASIGGSFPPHTNKDLADGFWFWDPTGPFSSQTHEGLEEFFSHSNCDGEITPEMCKFVADDLESALLYIAAREDEFPASGNMAAIGGYVQTTKTFVEGCRLAHQNDELLEFY